MPSPGVIVQRDQAATQVVAQVSTANVGVAGWFERGPDNEAQFLTGVNDLRRVFGSAVPFVRSKAYASLIAYFGNGGRRAYVVRVSPADAVTATGSLHAQRYAQHIETGAGAVGPLAKTSTTTTLLVNSGATPIIPESFSVKWRGSGTAVVAARLRNFANSANVDLAATTASYEVRINPTTLLTAVTAIDPDLDAIVSGSVTFSFNPDGAGARTATIAAGTGTVSLTNGQGSVFTLDLRTGIGSIKFAGTDVPDSSVVASSLTVSYTPTTPTYTATDDGAGTLTGAGVAAGTITYATGAYSITTTSPATPYTGAKFLATYKHRLLTFSASSPGVWGGRMVSGVPQGLKLVVSGDLSGLAAGAYSAHRMQVYTYDTDRAVVALQETYDGLDFAAADADTWPVSVLSDLSDLVVPSEDAGTSGLPQLDGLTRTLALTGGDETTGNRTLVATLPSEGRAIQPRSITLTYVDSGGTARTILDDGQGSLTGDLDATYATVASDVDPNGVDYTTRVLNFRTGHAISGGKLIGVSYRLVPEASSVTVNFGDTDEGFTEGTDGTFDSTNFGENQLTAAALEPSGNGIYALDAVDDIMHVIVPDLAGDLSSLQDQITWAQNREADVSGPDRFIIACPPQGYNAARASDWVLNDLQSFSQFCAVYWPHIRMRDPASPIGRTVIIPPLGHVAGVYSRTDATRGVYKSPAGTTDGALLSLEGLEFTPSQTDLDLIAESRINALREGRATGRCVWGARTLSVDRDYKYLSAMRTYQLVARSIFNSTFWTVFENLGPGLYSKLSGQIGTYLLSLFTAGYFPGATPAEAFVVQCDEVNNTQQMRDNGEYLVEYGFAHHKPGEFMYLRFAPRRPG